MKTLKNPIVLSILAGLTCNLLGVYIPESLFAPLASLSSSAISIALFSLGASIYFLPIKGNRTLAFIYSMAKLFILPLMAFLVAKYVFELSSEQTFILVLLLASPTGVGAYIMAKKYQQSENTAATTVVFSTLLTPFTYYLWIEFLR